MTYQFRLPIGDWSGDGHSICEYHTIESNLPLEEVRDIYWDATVRLGVSLDERYNKIDAPCGDYQVSTFDVDWLEKAGLTLEDLGLEEPDDDQIQANEELFVRMFIAFVEKHGAEQGVKLKLIEDQPTFTFYGHDKRQRHIGQFGYGLFD